MANRSKNNAPPFPLHAEKNTRFPGWGGVNRMIHPEFVPSYQAADALNITNRQGIHSYNRGVLSTRPGYADKPNYQLGGAADTTLFSFPSRMLAKFFPGQSTAGNGTFTGSPQVLRLGGSNTATAFQKFNSSTGGYDNVTASGYTNGALNGQWYPQHMVYGIPNSPRFCWVDPINGLHVYDGTTDVKQNVPKNSDSSANITGALWLAQIDGRLIVSGNWANPNETDIVYYSGVGDPTAWSSSSSPSAGGSFPVYAADALEGSPPKRVTGLATLHGALIVFSEDMRFVVTGIGTSGQSTREQPGAGCFSGRTIVKYEHRLFWWGKDGAYEWNGNEVIDIGQEVQKYLTTLAISKAEQFFSFVYEQQWWTCFETAAGGYLNLVFDLVTQQWYPNNIPMKAAFTSLTGLTDVGLLYFASPEAVAGNYKHYVYGVDPLNSYAAVYGDKVTGAAGARTATDIVAYWETGLIDCGDALTWKDFQNLHVRIGTGQSTPLSGNGAFTYARIAYNLDDDSGYSNTLNISEAASTPFHSLNFRGTDGDQDTMANLIQVKVEVSGTKRLDIKRAYIEYSIEGVLQHET